MQTLIFKELSDFDLYCLQWSTQQGVDDQDYLDEFKPDIADHLRAGLRGRYDLRLVNNMLGIHFSDPVDATVFKLKFSHLLE